MPTIKIYPDAGTGATTVDGTIRRYTGANLDWENVGDTGVRDGAGTDAFPSGAAMSISLGAGAVANTWAEMYRGIITFDTSAIPDDIKITSATLNLYIYGVSDNYNQSLCVVDSTPASDNNLVAADYQNIGTTEYATRLDLTSVNLNQFNAISLNATGLAAITKTGVTKIGLRLSCDVDNSEPTWVAATDVGVATYSADQGGAVVPYLEITYQGISADVGSFILTGIDVIFQKIVGMVASVGAFTLTGINVSLTKGYKIVCSVGNFVLTGYDAMNRIREWIFGSKNTSNTWTFRDKK